MHPCETLVLLVSMVVCRCDSSNLSSDVECVLISSSAYPYTTEVSFTPSMFSYMYHYKINKTTNLQIKDELSCE
jgi:hypothetical protein